MITESDIYSNNFEAIKSWAENNEPDVPLGNGTPLGLACFQGKIKTVKMLISAGASVNYSNDNGWTPLKFSSNDCRLNVIKFLLKNGAEVNATDCKGQTALHHLCFSNRRDNVSALQELLRFGADASAKNIDGLTPKDLAAKNKKTICSYDEFVSML